MKKSVTTTHLQKHTGRVHPHDKYIATGLRGAPLLCLTLTLITSPSPLKHGDPTPSMPAHLLSKHGMPDLIDHATGLNHPSSLDAIETLKAVQELINTYFAKLTADGRSTIPTPEPSPVLKFLEDGTREVVDMNGEHGEVAREDTVVVEEKAATNITLEDMPKAKVAELSMNVAEGTSGTSQPPLATHNMATKQDGRGESTSEKVKASLGSSKVEQDGSPTGVSNKEGGVCDSIQDSSSETSPPPATSRSDQNRLQHLVDDITRNISHSTTDDASRIKAATAALELAAEVRPPGDTIMGWFANMSVISAVRVFLHWGAFDIIPSPKGERITYADLAARVNADEGLVGQYYQRRYPSIPSPGLTNSKQYA